MNDKSHDARPSRVVALVLFALALALLIPGLGEAGLWTRGELPVLDRTVAALGEPRSNMLRSTWLPDQLRTWAYAASGRSDAGLRLPGALAGVGLVMLTWAFARRLGWSLVWSSMAACLALALPLLLVSSRTALGNPTGELWISATCLLLIGAADRSTPQTWARRITLGLLGVGCWGAAVASLGIVLGGCLPLLLLALADVARAPEHGGIELPRAVVIAAWAGAAAAGFGGLWLGWSQGEGYIPLLGAAKDLELLEDPSKYAFTDTVEALGYQLFPFTGLIVIGWLAPGRARWAALWLGVALVITSLWSMSYGPTPTPVVIPAALLGAAALERVFDSDEPIDLRRLIIACAVLGAVVLGKDAGRTPERVASPLLTFDVLEFPRAGVAPHFDVHEALPRLAKRFAALLLLAHLLAPPSETQAQAREHDAQPSRGRGWWLRQVNTLTSALERLLSHLSSHARLARLRSGISLALVFGATLWVGWRFGHDTLVQVGRQMSIAAPLQRYAAAVASGELPEGQLGLYRIRDAGLDHYGPGSTRERFINSRSELDVWLSEPEPRVALLRRGDFPSTYVSARTGKRPIYVLDAEHFEYLLVANVLPPGDEDQNPLLGIVYDEPISLSNQTYVAWEPFVQLVSWEIEGELHRGSSATLHMIFYVLRPLPAGTQMYARLQSGKVSRVAAEPHELTGGAIPPNFWRAGDYIHHRFEFSVPWLEVLPGPHDLIVGLRRSENANLKITQPSEKYGEFGVELLGNKSEFAKIGEVSLAW